MRHFLFIILFLLPFSVFADLQIRVVSVHDGDTLTATGVADSQKYKVRLLGVDTPEVDFYKSTQGEAALKARDVLLKLAPVGSIITLSDDSQVDKHGRVLGRLLRNGKDINLEMLRLGWGAMYFIYPFDKRIVSDYSKASKEAYDNRRGLFSNEFKNTEIPYEFRMRVQNQVGRNLIGDFELKKVVPPEDSASIPVWKRVFFPSFDQAHQNGYN
ncbi:MAG: endonuclease [Bdellovibrio sp. ArHS]|uniref:thermonuclease family protein n=1 Tax=Bdellovibrio sp. ArHS TaxID=1569284 RepID=UPI00058364CE|nr:thermonuclease family protein [Bdellovibrio sp. ArHS]KHD88897.1 MAG: endonuclease [Bdellovibrio sp. ArHS]